MSPAEWKFRKCDAQKVYGPDAESFGKYFVKKMARFEFYGVSRLMTWEVIWLNAVESDDCRQL